MCWFLKRPENGIKLHEVGRTSVWEPFNREVGAELQPSGRAASALKHWPISPSPPNILKSILCPGQLKYAELHHRGLHHVHDFMTLEKALKRHIMMVMGRPSQV